MPDMGAEIFDKKDEPFLQWTKRNGHGFVLNVKRGKGNDNLMFHRLPCHRVSGRTTGRSEGAYTKNDYFKVCSNSLADIEEWIAAHRPPTATIKLCGTCKPPPTRPPSHAIGNTATPGPRENLRPFSREQCDVDLADELKASLLRTKEERAKRLATAPMIPEKIQIISMGFRRNADVIVTVLQRAKGVCEKCKTKAPFIRRSDGSPYLEVHHRVPLSQGGEDTVQNAAALCPNCHRETHHA